MTDKITETANKNLKAPEPKAAQQSKQKSEEPIVVKRKPNEFGSFYR